MSSAGNVKEEDDREDDRNSAGNVKEEGDREEDRNSVGNVKEEDDREDDRNSAGIAKKENNREDDRSKTTEESDDEDEDEQDEFSSDVIYNVITKYKENPLELSTFATGGEIDQFTVGTPAVIVQGVGRIGYPLSSQQAAALVGIATQAPFGKGTETVVDVNVRKVWQISSDLVTINSTWLATSLPKIVTACCTKLGIDAASLDVRAELYKMLLYEEGGHFKKHRDTEKQPGMFGSLLVQLPAEHEGGHLVVEHAGQVKRFQFDKDSADKAYYTSFYADCEHELEPVKKGLRLVLAFNLVRHVGTMASAEQTATFRRGFEEVLADACRAWCADPDAVQKLVYPLTHQYTPTNVSFAGLKGSDRTTFELINNACDPKTGEKLFSVYLALVSKHVSGTEDEGGWGGGGGMCLETDIETNYATDAWVGPRGAVHLGSLEIDFETELLIDPDEDHSEVCEEIFGDTPDREEKEGYQGNYPGTLEYWYSAAVIAFWPAAKDFDIKLFSNFEEAAVILRALDRTSVEYQDKLTRLLHYLRIRSDWSFQSVLALATNLQQTRKVLTMGVTRVVSEGDVQAVCSSVDTYGMEPLHTEISAILAALSLNAAVDLLSQLKLRCNAVVESDDGGGCTGGVSQVRWRQLLQKFVEKIAKNEKFVETESVMVKVCLFVIANCLEGERAAVAEHVGGRLQLGTLNYVITQLIARVQDEATSTFVQQLQLPAVQRCAQQRATPATADILMLMEWVVRGKHTELLAVLMPRLKKLVSSQELYMKLFAVPVVVEELKTASPLSLQLASLLRARIAALEPCITPPAFNWAVPEVHPRATHPHVTAFLANPRQQQFVETDFNGIQHARNYANLAKSKYVSAVPSGIGRNAHVTLTKNKVYYEERTRACAVNQKEIRTLRALLQSHPGKSSRNGEASTSSTVCQASSGVTQGPDELEGGIQQPAAKKQRSSKQIGTLTGAAEAQSAACGTSAESPVVID